MGTPPAANRRGAGFVCWVRAPCQQDAPTGIGLFFVGNGRFLRRVSRGGFHHHVLCRRGLLHGSLLTGGLVGEVLRPHLHLIVKIRLGNIPRVLQIFDLGQVLLDEEPDADALITKILHRAELEYEFCSAGDADPATMQIRKACAEYKPTDGFPHTFYKEVVSKVILYRDTHIEFKLQNGQIV